MPVGVTVPAGEEDAAPAIAEEGAPVLPRPDQPRRGPRSLARRQNAGNGLGLIQPTNLAHMPSVRRCSTSMNSPEFQDKLIRERARELRRAQTANEMLLWRQLRNRRFAGEKFRRQHPIEPYIVDFVCLSRRLIVELDGGQHAERRNAYDLKRDDYLRSRGFRILRFWNNEVFDNLEGVLDRIQRELEIMARGS